MRLAALDAMQRVLVRIESADLLRKGYTQNSDSEPPDAWKKPREILHKKARSAIKPRSRRFTNVGTPRRSMNLPSSNRPFSTTEIAAPFVTEPFPDASWSSAAFDVDWEDESGGFCECSS